VHPDLAADFPPLKSLDARPNNLPIQLTSFIGREREKAEVGRLLFTNHLVTLTGAGGAGKTRLALQVAAEALEEFPDGVWLVELAALSNPDLVPKAVASALGVSEQPARSLTETLRDALRRKSVLVVLDNCEHLVAACADLADALLRACPNLRMLATSLRPSG
jgi:predicted ATPase